MYKLKTLYNEIKLIGIGNITPDMVMDLDTEIIQHSTESSEESYFLIKNKYNWNTNHSFDHWLKEQSPQKLKQIYTDLLKIKAKYKKLDEIKLIPNISPQQVFNLINNFREKSMKHGGRDFGEVLIKLHKFDTIIGKYIEYPTAGINYIKTELNEMSKDKLVNLYQELTEFIKK